MAEEKSKNSGPNWVERLMRAMQNLPGAKRGSKAREKPDPEDYAWKETEEQYQQAQAEWLKQVQSGRKKKKKE